MSIELTRRQLYNLVWSEPMRPLASKLGTYDSSVAKICRDAKVPLPPRGYWSRQRAGYQDERTPLPPADFNTSEVVSLLGAAISPELSSAIEGEPGSFIETIETIKSRAEQFRSQIGKVLPSTNFDVVDPEIKEVIRKDQVMRNNPHPLVRSMPPKLETPAEQRRLLILNDLFLGVAKANCHGVVAGSKARQLKIRRANSSLHIELEFVSMSRRSVRLAGPSNEQHNKLRLRILPHDLPPDFLRSWEDQSGQPLETQLTDMIVGLATAAYHADLAEVARAKEWREEEQARLHRLVLEEAERRKLRGLHTDAENWRKAAEIRAYVAASRANGRISPTRDEAWEAWALSQADALDPLMSERC